MNYCCKEMKNFIEDPGVPVKYNKIVREYSLPYKNSAVIIKMDYCPWCAKKLPMSLRDELFDTLENEYGLDLSISEIRTNPLVPPEFLTDEWWKKRGL